MDKKIIRMLHSLIYIIVDLLFIQLSAVVCYFAQGGFADISEFALWAEINAVLLVCVFSVLGLYNMLYSHANIMTGFKIVLSSCLIWLANVVYVIIAGQKIVTYWGLLIFFLCVILSVTCVRFSLRLIILFKHRLQSRKKEVRVLIVGGGNAGSMVIREMQQSDKIFYKPVCVVDDDALKTGMRVDGVKIVGVISDIPEVVKKHRIEEVFICMPSVKKSRIVEISELCMKTGVTAKILPGMYQFAKGQFSVDSMRKVEIADLLGREQVEVNLEEIIGYIENKCVLVTGGGGSIGSELCRQIAAHNPARLIIFDIYENNAYELEQELLRKNPNLNLLTLIGSVRDKGKVQDLFKTYRPQIVFHAAAHKHVPLMETSPNEAVKNNVYGTLNVVNAAKEFETETFVQISTDKAVNPTNIMGATKRICEMIIQTAGRHSEKTKFVAVRFGNVLGSNGSVIPLFKKQIEDGGPVTVTDRNIIRYFMTIPEAVSLVLQAGAYAESGQIFVLDMGEPVKIYDLAYNLIKLSGFEPNVDIKIECVGLRPGEKLFEERLMKEEGLQKTPNGLINIAKPIELDEEKLWNTLDRLYNEAYLETDDMKELVKDLVPTYKIDKKERK